MKRLLLAAAVIGTALVATAPASAAQGCGPHGHRDRFGHCRPDGRYNRPFGPRVGAYQHGRGYWDGHRYWQHRERFHNGWRYR